MAGGSIIGALRIVLGLDTAQFETGAKKAEGQASALSSRLTNSFNGAASAATSLKGAVASLGGALAVKEMVEATRRAFDYADAIQDLSDRTGASTKLIQEFRYAAQESGSSVETADEALGKFAKTLGLAQAGTDEQVKMFRKLGVTSSDFDTAFRQTLDGLSKLPTIQERNATALQFFGKSAATLTGLLGLGTAGFDDLAAAAHRLGIVIDGDLIKNAGVVNDRLDDMKMLLDAQFANAIVSNADAIGQLATQFLHAAGAAAQFFASIKNRASLRVLDNPNGTRVGAFLQGLDPKVERRKAFDTLLENKDGRQALFERNRASRLALRNGDVSGLGADGAGIPDNPTARAQERQRLLRERAAIVRAQRAARAPETGKPPPAGTLPTSGTGEAASAASKAEAARKKAEADAKRDADKARRTDERFRDQLSRERSSQLNSEAELAVTQTDRVNAEQAILDQDKESRLAEIARDQDMTSEQKKQLSGMVEETAILRSRLLHRRDQEELARQEFEHQERIGANQSDILNATAQLARTSKERREIELQLLDLQSEQLMLEQQRIIDSPAATPIERADAATRQATLVQLRELARQRTMQDTQGPLGSYLDSLPKSAAELNEAYESVAVDGLKSLNDGLAAAITGTKSLGDVFSDMASSIVADLARIAVQQIIVKPLAERLFGGAQASGGGILGGLSQIFGGSNGAGSGNAIGSLVEGDDSFARRFGNPMLQMGSVLGALGRVGIDTNILPANLMADSRVSAVSTVDRARLNPANDRQRAQPAPIYISVEEGALFRPVVRSEAGAVTSAGISTVAKKQSWNARQTLR